MEINEFVAKKLGEVLAFNTVGSETLERGRDALVATLGEEFVLDQEEKNKLHNTEIIRIATDAGIIDTTLAKSAKTEQKLRAMRDLYVADQWDNATELLEWSGFFEGAAIVHWNLIRGAGEGLDNEALMMLSNESNSYHYKLLEKAETELMSVGQNRATI